MQTLVLEPERSTTQSVTDLYCDMKRAMPLQKIINTTLRQHPGLSKREVENRIDALAQWMAAIPIAVHEGRWFQMIETVDVVWHSFILHTRDYAEFCQRFYDGFLHHDPPMDYDEDRRAYAEYTLGILRREFGAELNPLFEDMTAEVKCCYRYVIE